MSHPNRSEIAALAIPILLVLSFFCAGPSVQALSSAAPPIQSSAPTSPATKFAILGGTGKIGTAVASHLLQRSPGCEIILVGRRTSAARDAICEIESDLRSSEDKASPPPLPSVPSKRQTKKAANKISFHQIDDIWTDTEDLARFFRAEKITGVIHTAGPYADETPTVLDAAIAAKVPVYVDVSDPLPFLELSQQRHDAAVVAGTTALCAAGAFPGMSNVLAMEAAAAATKSRNEKGGGKDGVKDVRFHYFTKGLGGSGTVNLYITNLGFGDPMTQYDNGQRRAFQELSGRLLGEVDFFLPSTSISSDDGARINKDNEQARQRVGTQQVFAWPFPEATTVATQLQAKGSSSAAMGTAPDLWNVMLGVLVNIVPRPWWRSARFSKFMADFSQPLVLFTDALLQRNSPDAVGETHAMRIDVTTAKANTMVSVVQAHESFRRCVGLSCAEFALDVLQHPAAAGGGVYLPEQRYQQASDRERIISKLTSTPGTFCYTGPVRIQPSATEKMRVYPTEIERAVALAKQVEAQQQ